ncbi:MAG TPA: hemagglutinin repeat-containing protein, partial [Burkholderiaceae bacterium]|nr:hemagglutinin repeat-containing protein [Burkholderiaceae bacterium]
RISGADVSVEARGDLNNLGGTIDAVNSLSATAGGDLNVRSSTQQISNGSTQHTVVDRIAGLYVTGEGGSLSASAGGNLNVDGARIVNAGQGGSTVLSAGQDLNLGSVKGSGATVATTVQGQGDTVLSAGRDLSTRNAQVGTTQGTLTLKAGHDLALKGGQVASGGALEVVADRNVNLDPNAPALRAQGNLQIQAGQDLNAQALQARSDTGTLALVAGRDVNLLAKTTTVGGGDNSRTTVQGSSLSGAHVVVTAGNNATLQAAQVVATTGGVSIVANNDLNLSTATEAERSKTQRDANNWKREATSTEVGTQIVAQGDIVLNAGQDINARAAQVNSATGAVMGIAGRDLKIEAGETTYEMEQATQSTSKKLFSKKTTTTYDAATQVSAVGSTFSGDSTVLQAGRDLAVTGSTVVATNATVLTAGGNVSIEAAKESLDETHKSQTKKSGLMSGGGFGITLGTKRTSTDAKTDGTLATASMVGSTNGSVVIEAGKDYTQTGSQVITPIGDVDIRAQKVVIDEAEQTTTSRIKTEVKQSGVTLALSGGVIDAIQGVQRNAKAMGDTQDDRAKALAVANIGMQGMGGKGGQPGQAGQDSSGVSLSLSIGGSQSSSQTDSSSRMAVGSTVAAGGNLSITAAGAGKDSDLTVQGSRVQAGGDASLKAEGDLLLQAAKN